MSIKADGSGLPDSSESFCSESDPRNKYSGNPSLLVMAALISGHTPLLPV